jgi:membrane protein
VAAGTTFFILLALFPAVAAVVSLYGLFADRGAIAHELDVASPFLPRGAVIVIHDELNRLIAQKPQKMGWTFAFSTVIALWSASGGIKALVEGLNAAYDKRETRGFLRLSAVALLMTAIGILLAVFAINFMAIIPVVVRYVPYRSGLREMLPILSFAGAFITSLAVLAAIYGFGPNRSRWEWHWVTWGSVTAAILWLLGTALFKLYVQNFGSFDRVYGSLGAAIGFLTWIWLSIVILLFGAELNCEIERRSRGLCTEQ